MTNRMINADELSKILNEWRDAAAKNPAACGELVAFSATLGVIKTMLAQPAPPPLRYDVERVALDAYSEVQAERLALRIRQGSPLQQRDHRDALLAAIDAVDKLRSHENKE